jgi:hypothetical protein
MGSEEANALADQLSGIAIENPQEPHADKSAAKNAKNRRRKGALEGANAIESPAVSLRDGSLLSLQSPQYLFRKREWRDLPDWIVLSDERGKPGSKPFPPLSDDLLFRDDGGPMVLPFAPPEGVAHGRAATSNFCIRARLSQSRAGLLRRCAFPPLCCDTACSLSTGSTRW